MGLWCRSNPCKAKAMREIAARDQRDRSREASPLRPAADAILIDTTSMGLDEVLERATELVQSAQNTPGL